MKDEFKINIHSDNFYKELEELLDRRKQFYSNEEDLDFLEEKLHDFSYKVNDYIEELYYNE